MSNGALPSHVEYSMSPNICGGHRVPAPSDGRESRKSDVYVCVCVVVLLFL